MGSRNYMLTDFNLENDLNQHADWIKYAIWQVEQCPKTGKRHIQAYIELPKPMRINQVKNLYGCSGIHLEKRRGNQADAIQYCSKEDTRCEGPWEFGERGKGQGHRSDLDAVAEMVKEKKSLREIAEEHPATFIRYHRGIKELKNTTDDKKRTWKTEVFIVIGEPGIGKTRWAWENFDDIYVKPHGTKWWDGYTGQEDVLIDDYNGYMEYEYLLQLCDRYPMKVETKGGHVEFLAKYIIITSNKVLESWYTNTKALKRRVTEFIEV